MGAYNVVNRPALASGQPEDISQVLANFDAIAAVLNGGIDNFNINAAAAILASKLAGYPADASKILKGDGSWGSAGTIVAATIAGLGAVADGKQGRLRLGATPFEFLDLVYDATYGKWVSPSYAIWSTPPGQFQPGVNLPGVFGWNPGAAATNWISGASTLFKRYTDAGLTPQLRLMGTAFRQTTTFQHSIDLWHQTADNVTADSARFGVTFGILPLANPGAGTYYGYDSGWTSVVLPGVPKDILIIVPRVDSAAAGSLIFSGSCHIRWVA